jgi:hypothetical protein
VRFLHEYLTTHLFLRLEYKYHKLIQNASGHPGELPGAPQCVGDDDDGEEEDVRYVGIYYRINRDDLQDI